MTRVNCNSLLIVTLCLAFGSLGAGESYSVEISITPQEVIAAHIKSIGNPEAIQSIKNRGITGTATVQFVQGGTPGIMIGQALFLSAGQNLGIIMRYGAVEYPGEHFAFDGKEVTVANIAPGQRSPLGDFLFRYGDLMKEGFIGGVLSLGWPLLNLDKKQPRLKCDMANVDGRELYEMEYSPQKYMNDIRIKLFFAPDTFRHVRTEYRLVVHGEQSLLGNTPYTRGEPKTADAWNVSSRYSKAAENQGFIQGVNILDEISDSIYVLVEKFDKFKEIEFKAAKSNHPKSLTLPQSYSIELSIEGQGSTFLGRWNMEAAQWIQNGKVDSSFFKAQR
jgi:hypothetical protein